MFPNVCLSHNFSTPSEKINGSAQSLYLTTFSIFILTFGFIFVSPVFLGKSYSYENTEMGVYQTVTNNVKIALVSKEFNPNSHLMRLDYLIEDTGFNTSMSNIKFEMLVQDIETRKEHNIEIIRVSDSYLVVLIKGIEQGFFSPF